MANDRKKLDGLIDAIGQIDESFIHEAGNVTPFTFAGFRKKKRRILPILLAAALSCALLLGVFTILNTPDKSGFDRVPGQTDVPGNTATRPDGPKGNDPLEVSLLSLKKEQLDGHRINGNELFLDGICRLIWTVGDGSYYAVTITGEKDLSRLGEYLSDPKSIVPADEVPDAADSGVRFWITTGNGLSATPYLLYGAWGAGNLFDYNPESLPSSDFASFLIDLIQKNLGNTAEF